MEDEDNGLATEANAGDDAQLNDTAAGNDEGHQSQDDSPPSVDDLASEMGWSPKDKWRGDPAKWKPAAEFLRTTVDYNKGLRSKLETMEDKLSRMDRVSVQMAERAAQQARAEAVAEHQRAVDEGDHQAAFQAAQKVQAIETSVKADVTPPETRDFVSRHASWWGKDDEATKVAMNLAQSYADRGYSPARQIAAVEREMAKDFPEYFKTETPRQQAKAPMLATPGARTAPPRAKGYDDLPTEAKKAAEESERRGWGTKAEYAKIYFEEQA